MRDKSGTSVRTQKGAGSKGKNAVNRGPRKANLWPRRIITTSGLLIIIIVLVLAIAQVGKFIFSSTDQVNQESGTESKSAPPTTLQSTKSESGNGVYTVTEQNPIGGLNSSRSIGPCRGSDLEQTISLSQAILPVGAGLTVEVHMEKKSDGECYTSFDQQSLKIRTGDRVVFDGSQCAQDASRVQRLLFSGKESWKGTLQWNGHVYKGCTPVTVGENKKEVVSDPGTYVVQVFDNGKQIGGDSVVTIR